MGLKSVTINSKGCVMVPNVIQNGLNLITRHFKLLCMGFKISQNQFQGVCNGPQCYLKWVKFNYEAF